MQIPFSFAWIFTVLLLACGGGSGSAPDAGADAAPDAPETCRCNESELMERVEEYMTPAASSPTLTGGTLGEWGLYTSCKQDGAIILGGGCTFDRHDNPTYNHSWHGFYTPDASPDTQPMFDRWMCASSKGAEPGSGILRSAQAACVNPAPGGCPCEYLPSAETFAERIVYAQSRMPLEVNKPAQLTAECPPGTELLTGSCSLLGPAPPDPAWDNVILSRSSPTKENAHAWTCGVKLVEEPLSEQTLVLDLVCARGGEETLDDKAFSVFFLDRIVGWAPLSQIGPGVTDVRFSCDSENPTLRLLWGGCLVADTSDESYDVRLLSAGYPADAPGGSRFGKTWQCVWDNPTAQQFSVYAYGLCLWPSLLEFTDPQIIDMQTSLPQACPPRGEFRSDPDRSCQTAR